MPSPLVARAVALAVGLVTAALAPPAWAHDAGDSRLALAWTAPSDCPGRDAVLTRVRQLLGEAPSATPLDARAVISEHGGRYRLELSTVMGQSRGARTLNAASCNELVEPAALVLALAIDPDAAARAARFETQSVEPSVALEPAADSTFALAALRSSIALSLPRATRSAFLAFPDSTSLDDRAPGPATRSRGDVVRHEDRRDDTGAGAAKTPSTVHARAGAGGILDAGTLPAPAAGVAAALAVGSGRLEIEARGALFASQTEGVGSGNGAAAGRLGLWSAGLSGCVRVFEVETGGRRSARVAPCVGTEVARLSGRGEGVSSPGEGAVWLGAAVAGARGALDVTDTASLWLRVDGAAALNRPRFVLENVGAVHEPAAISARAALGAEVRFP